MYGHGFATLYLAEVYGMSPRDDLREKLARAVELIVRTQNAEGGWRYQPRPEDADISVTICQVMALRAARNAGLRVPRETIDRCVDYVKRSQNADGGFRYMLPAGPKRISPLGGRRRRALQRRRLRGPGDSTAGSAYLDQFLPCRQFGWRRRPFFLRPLLRGASDVAGRRRAAGSGGIRPCATCSSNGSRPTARGPTRSARNTAPRWPRSFCKCPTTACRSSSDEESSRLHAGVGDRRAAS